MASKHSKKIGWQKYEDFLEKQLFSPLLTKFLQNISSNENEDEDLDEGSETVYDDDKYSHVPIFPISPQIIENITLLSSYDCWIGHTNFDLTHSIKDTLNSISGIEVLKICSRYRFFIGVGQMFDFSTVRNNIEKIILKGD